MRHIDTTRLVVPAPWLTKVAKARAAVEAAVAAHHAPVFPSHWTDPQLRDALIEIVGQKCWYCETKVHSSNPDVDHFRPKLGRVAVDGHLGYWWLAYDPANYRIACKYCNSGGAQLEDGSRPASKVARFPLLIEADRAIAPADDYRREKPVLLDPTDRADWILLDFSADGRARRRSTAPMSSSEDRSMLYRVTESIALYQLDRLLLREDRVGVMDRVGELATLAASISATSSLSMLEKMLRDMIDPHSEYSSAALSALRARRDIPVIEERFAADFADQLPEVTLPEAERPTVDLSYMVRIGAIQPNADLTGLGSLGDVTARVLADGRVQFGARVYASPDSAARAATGDAAIDGWMFWSAATDGGQMTLAQMRDLASSVPLASSSRVSGR